MKSAKTKMKWMKTNKGVVVMALLLALFLIGLGATMVSS